MQIPNNKGELCVAVCPDCNMYSVCDPAWLACEGELVKFVCENCSDHEMKNHLIVKFVEAK